MAYAAYRYPPGMHPTTCGTKAFKVLTITMPTADCYEFRRKISALRDVGILRCLPALHASAAFENSRPRAVMYVWLPSLAYADVVHCVAECATDGEIGHSEAWNDYLDRIGVCHGE